MKMSLVSTACLLVIAYAQAGDIAPPTSSLASISVHENQLNLEQDSSLSWRASVGRTVSIKAPQLTLIIPGDITELPFKVKLRKHSVQKGEAVLEYELSLSHIATKLTQDIF